MDADGRVVGDGDLKAQASQVYRNLAAVLAEAGCTLRDVVKFTTFLVRNEDWAPFAEWRKAEYPAALSRRRLPGEHGRGGAGAGAARAAPRGGGDRRAPRPAPRPGPGGAPARKRAPARPRRRAGPGAGVGDGEGSSAAWSSRVKYVFGLARGGGRPRHARLELPPGATVFEALRRLGVSALELHAAVNGESAADGTVLRDGDEVILIPSIQGGRAGGAVMKRMTAMVSALVGLGLGGIRAGARGGPDPGGRAHRHSGRLERCRAHRRRRPSVTVTTRTQSSHQARRRRASRCGTRPGPSGT